MNDCVQRAEQAAWREAITTALAKAATSGDIRWRGERVAAAAGGGLEARS